MRNLRFVLLAMLLALPLAATAKAQEAVGVGPAVVADPNVYDQGYAYGPPVCDWGYYAYYPYACAPYGYYGPQWFYGGAFIGVGPWYRWGWGRGGYGWGRGRYGYRGGYAYGGRGGYGGRGAYGGRAPYAGVGNRGGYGRTQSFNGGARGYSGGRVGGYSGGARPSGGFSGGGHMGGGFGGGGHMGGGGGHGGGGHR